MLDEKAETEDLTDMPHGKGLGFKYTFDNSKNEKGTSELNINFENLKWLNFDNSRENALNLLWESLVETMQGLMEREDDDQIVRLLLPDLNLFTPQLSKTPSHELPRFLRSLKTLVRQTNCVCVLSCDV